MPLPPRQSPLRIAGSITLGVALIDLSIGWLTAAANDQFRHPRFPLTFDEQFILFAAGFRALSYLVVGILCLVHQRAAPVVGAALASAHAVGLLLFIIVKSGLKPLGFLVCAGLISLALLVAGALVRCHVRIRDSNSIGHGFE